MDTIADSEVALSGPTGPDQRIQSIDTLRGVAVLGILVMNVYAYGLPWAAYTNPWKGGGTSWIDHATWCFTHVFFDMKFMAVFSMLFGAGVVLMSERNARFGTVYYRRLFVLLLFGLGHAYFLWFGDILAFYAICGALAFPFRRFGPRLLLALAGISLALGVAIGVLFGGLVLPRLHELAERGLELRATGQALTAEQRAGVEMWETVDPPPERLAEETAVYRGSDYLSQLRFRAGVVLELHTTGLFAFALWRITGLMLAGMALMKLGVLSARRSNGFYRRMAGWGYGVGVPLVAIGTYFLYRNDFDPLFVFAGGDVPNYVGSLFVAAGHVAAVMLWCRGGRAAGLRARLARVGRLALTNYLSQTVVCVTLFYGWGLGLFGELGRTGLMGVVAAVWALQLWFSGWWVSRFGMGPLERIWRWGTYS